jgi:hypothetical protein
MLIGSISTVRPPDKQGGKLPTSLAGCKILIDTISSTTTNSR